jgi:hypothetical protein
MSEKQNAAPSGRTGGAPNSNFAGSKSGSEHRSTLCVPQGRRLCGSCRFFHPWSHSETTILGEGGQQLHYGECRFDPPKIFEASFSGSQGEFPQVSPADWCGKHEVSQ